ncbi:MAG TPA: carboxypeptidase-like regulatory domain-containing protein, partial [Phycisphaerae bacterium]|nr:carboxypeptidase-like regulatory domain-containing protein [Phycisphaerae bacterium]
EEADVQACVKLAKKVHALQNGKCLFDEDDTRQALEAVLARRKDWFYAEFLLGLWHRNRGDAARSTEYLERAYRHAPVIVVQRYEDEAGKPVAGISVQVLELECNRVQRGWMDPSLHLYYPDLRTDEAGCVYLPAYDTVFRLASAAHPTGYGVSYPRLGWFECPKKVGLLPVCTLRPKPVGPGMGEIGEVAEQFLSAMRDKDLETMKRLSLGAEWGWLSDEQAGDLPFKAVPGFSVALLKKGLTEWHEEAYPGRSEEMTKIRGLSTGDGFAAVRLADYKPGRYMVLVFKQVPDGWRFVTWDDATGPHDRLLQQYAGRLEKSLPVLRPYLRPAPPPPAPRTDARRVAEAFLAAAIAGQQEEAIRLTRSDNGPRMRNDVREFGRPEAAKLKIARVHADDKAALAETTPTVDDQGREGVLILLLDCSGGRWVVQEVGFVLPSGSVRDTRREFLERHPRAVEVPAPAPAPATPPDPTAPARGPEQDLELRVTDRDTDQPVPAASLTWKAEQLIATDGKTDGQGKARATVGRIRNLRAQVRVDKGGYAPAMVFWFKDPPAGEVRVVRLSPSRPIGGIIRDEQNAPVVGARVSVWLPREAISLIVTTDDQGRWRAENAPTDLAGMIITVDHEDYLQANVQSVHGTAPLPPPEALWEMTARIVMAKGIAVSGTVRDGTGGPVGQARVRCTLGSQEPERSTDAQGRYRLAVRAAAGKRAELLVSAAGWAPQRREVVLESPETEASFTLAPGKTIRGRVVDTHGKPIAGVWVRASEWGRWWAQTDAHGRFAWTDAPDATVSFSFAKEGYRSRYGSENGPKLAPSDDEHSIVLRPSPRVRGKVVDGRTGKPIEAFNVFLGPSRGPTSPDLVSGTKFPGKGGSFEVSLAGSAAGSYRVRVEAVGYEKAVSDQFDCGDGDVSVGTLRLVPARMSRVAGVVRTPDGQPAEGALVSIAGLNKPVYVGDGEILRNMNSPTPIRTDGAGRFSLPWRDESALVVTHAGGYAEIPAAELEADNEITLKGWARVEGTLKIADRPGVSQTIELSWPFRSEGVHYHYQAVTDGQGRFRFDHVPPGDVRISRYVKISRTTLSNSHHRYLALAPGATARVQLGGTGRPVVGKLVAPANLPVKMDWTRSAGVTLNLDRSSDTGDMRFRDWMHTPAGRAYVLATRSYGGGVNADGTFRIEDVPPGRYVVTVSAGEPLPPGMWLSARREFVVAEIPTGRSDQPLDLGPIPTRLEGSPRGG